MAEPFQHISGAAVKVLARLAARKAAKEQFQSQGVKHYKHADLLRQASEYLAGHPELYEQALATAWELSARDHQGRINAVLFDDDRRGWRKPRRPVLRSDHDKTSTENTTENMQLVSD
jgi:hypothetical protein